MITSLNRLKLAFPDAGLEGAWREHTEARSRPVAFAGMLVFGIVLLLGVFADFWQKYEGWQDVVVVRVLVWVPSMLIGAAVVRSQVAYRHVRDVVFAVVVAVTLSLIALMVGYLPRSAAADYPMYWSVLLILVHVLAPSGFWRSTLAGFVVVTGFFITMSYHQVSEAHMSPHASFIIFAWLQLIAASWLLENQGRATFLANRKLATAQEDSERVLKAVLPNAIADRLKAGEQIIADEVADATVLFADLVGFTELSRTMKAGELVAFLDRLFTSFDARAEHHGVDKVKTIGDAYMCVSGTTGDADGVADRIAALALDLHQIVRDIAADTRADIALRIGIHRGPLVAGIIGRSRFSYDLWGDTVNLASRMESQGRPGAVQVSSSVAEALQGRFPLERRGEIDIKGVGLTETWWLGGPE